MIFLLAALLAVLPSPSPSPAASAKPPPLFVVPRSWVKIAPQPKDKANGVNEIGSYILAENGEPQEFNVLEAPAGGLDLATMTKINEQDLAKIEKRFALLSEETVPLCGGQQGRLIKFHAASNGKLRTYEQLFAVSGSTGYVATYSRASSQKESPIALAALRSLCPPIAPPVAVDTTSVPFTPPAGWQRLNPSAFPSTPGGVEALWIHPSGGSIPDSLNVVKSESHVGSVTASQVSDVMTAAVKQKFPGATVRQSHAETVCNGTAPGWFVEYAVRMNGNDLIVQQAVIFAENVQYAATYARAATQPEDAAARKSLDTLCAEGAQTSG